MKNTFNQSYLIITVFVITIFVAACSNEKTVENAPVISERTIEGDEDKTSALIQLEGMSCEVGCAKYIQNKLAKLDGVTESDVLFEEKTARISYDPAKISVNEIVTQIHELNDGQYKVGKVDVEKTVKKQVSFQENSSYKKSGNDEKIENVSYEPPFKSIAFPNIFNLFKLKLV